MLSLAIFVAMDSTIVVSERNKPFWQLPIAALCFTISFALISAFVLQFFMSHNYIEMLSSKLFYCLYSIPIGLGLCTQKRVHIDLKNSRFKPTTEIGNLKFGTWKTIHNYKYVSVFQQPLTNGTTTFQVNLWYDHNKHFELYDRNSFKDAFIVGYELSEELNIDLLDATIPREFKWIDKSDWKQQMNEHAS